MNHGAPGWFAVSCQMRIFQQTAAAFTSLDVAIPPGDVSVLPLSAWCYVMQQRKDLWTSPSVAAERRALRYPQLSVNLTLLEWRKMLSNGLSQLRLNNMQRQMKEEEMKRMKLFFTDGLTDLLPCHLYRLTKCNNSVYFHNAKEKYHS